MHATRRRWLTLLLALSMIGTISAPPAAARGAWTKRTVTSPYTGAGGAAGGATGTAVIGGERYGGVALSPQNDEVLVTLRLTDDTGRPVLAEVSQDRDGDGAPDPRTTVRVCGATDEPLPTRPGVRLTVRMTVGPCDGGFSTPTQGLVTATFLAPAGDRRSARTTRH